MINDDVYNKILDCLADDGRSEYIELFSSIDKNNFNFYKSSPEESFYMLKAHQDASGLEYFSTPEVFLLLNILRENKESIINIVTGQEKDVLLTFYFSNDFSDCFGVLSFNIHKKSDEEICEEMRVLGISDED